MHRPLSVYGIADDTQDVRENYPCVEDQIRRLLGGVPCGEAQEDGVTPRIKNLEQGVLTGMFSSTENATNESLLAHKTIKGGVSGGKEDVRISHEVRGIHAV